MSLEIDNLSLSYGNCPILHQISCSFPRGEICVIVGPNGSGKSSLIKCLNHLVHPQKGSVRVDGKVVYDLSPREIAKLFGYVPQNFQDSFPATVMETILMGRRPYSSWRFGKEDILKAVSVMNHLHLESFALRNHSELSGGQRQKVMIARALVQESPYLLFDEPTSQLDICHQLEIMDIVRDMVRHRGILAVIVVHDLNLAARYADRVIMLRDGRIYADGDPREVLTQKSIGEVYQVESLVIHDGDIPCIVPMRKMSEQG